MWDVISPRVLNSNDLKTKKKKNKHMFCIKVLGSELGQLLLNLLQLNSQMVEFVKFTFANC